MSFTQEQLSKEVRWQFSRSSGKGGQHVNKTSTKVTLFWKLQESALFSENQKSRIAQKLASKINAEGALVLDQESERSQYLNRKLALRKLAKLLKDALRRPKPRKATQPPPQALAERKEKKSKRSAIKSLRRPPKLNE